MGKFFSFLGILIFALNAGATTFQPVDTVDQIKEADGIIIGHFLKEKSVRLEDGTIATQMIFKMDKEFGLRSDFFGMDEVIVHYPGGTIGEESVHIGGIPKFVSGEKVALYTKSHENRYWGLNLGFGTYRVIDYGNNVMLVNSIFPEHPRVGQIKLVDFEKMVKTIKGSNLKVVQSAQFIENPDAFAARQPASSPEGKNRTLASENEETDNTSESRSISAYWLLGLLAFFGGLFRMNRQKRA